MAEETFKKVPEDEISIAQAFDTLVGLANPKGFAVPKDVLDRLVDMPYMEHIPRTMPCAPDSVCYSCKK